MVSRINPYVDFTTLVDRVNAVEAANRTNDYASASANFVLTANAILSTEAQNGSGDPLDTGFDTDPYAQADPTRPLRVG